MKNVSELHEVLYVSTLAPEASLQVVAKIAAKSRIANGATGITGVLIFDGMRFCQQIEGPRTEVLALIQRIRQDSRHVNVEILRHGPLEARRFKRFALGYVSVDDVEVLAHMEGSGPEQALTQFLALLPNLDMGG
ncbi:BLUF domain-containing protein [Polaromonas sp.]|uniref:BLUF domain-containing protein n=1 Tax=Polaromonas sp. TaxID=1869339 RepID=UPI0027306B2E|nr:BLUF domain-containing protein [Polaromonas sp.]MDP1742719.1 BLUF domain-containing protein [Polaromonas sp.]